MQAWIDLIKKFIEEFAPAIAVALWNYEEDKVSRANTEKEKAETDLQVEKNHEQIDSKYAGKSDADIVNDAIVNGGGDPGQLESDSSSSGTGIRSGNGLGQTPKPPTGNT